MCGYRGDGDEGAAAGELMPSELYHAGTYENLLVVFQIHKNR